jgi:hypothetical protein
LLVRRKGDFGGSGAVFSFIAYLVYLAALFGLSFFHGGKVLFTVKFDNVPAGIYFVSFSALT